MLAELLALVLAASPAAPTAAPKLTYPSTKKVDVVDDYFVEG